MNEKGFEIVKSVPTGYEFDKPCDLHQSISASYEEMWRTIYPHFRFDRSNIENYYTKYDMSNYFKVIRKVIWYDVTPDKFIHEVFGYMNTISAY